MPLTVTLNKWSGISRFFVVAVIQACLLAFNSDGISERENAGLQESQHA